jgi:hypothetical protein
MSRKGKKCYDNEGDFVEKSSQLCECYTNDMCKFYCDDNMGKTGGITFALPFLSDTDCVLCI